MSKVKGLTVTLDTEALEKVVEANTKRAQKAVEELHKVATELGIEIRVTFYQRGQKLFASAVLDGTKSDVIGELVTKSKFSKVVSRG